MEFSNLERATPGSDRPVVAQPSPSRIRLVLLDDHLLFRESLGRLLSSEDDFDLVAECTTTSEALRNVRNADVILVDIDFAKEFIPCARKARCSVKSLVIARDVDATGSAIVLKYGASGIFMTSDSSRRLLQAIRLVASGEAWVDQKVIEFLAGRYPHCETRHWGDLTEREDRVLKAVVDGRSNREIGDQIGVSESTVKAALQQLFNKAGVRTRSQLVRIAMEGQPVLSSHSNSEG